MAIHQDLEWAEAQKIVVSTDLVAAAKKQLEFLEAVDNNGKLYNGPVLEKAIFRYKYCWLPLLAKHTESKLPEWQLVVPLDCEWIWHCHRLNPVRYMADCKELFGRILDSGSGVMSSVGGTCKKRTEEMWMKMYPEEPYELDFSDESKNATESETADLPSTNYDLVAAVKRQSSFYYQVSRTYMRDDIFLEGAVQRYKGFLHMIRRNFEMKSKNFCVPTYDIDLIWHTHQLHPVTYCEDMLTLLDWVLNHDDTDTNRGKGAKLDVGFTSTTKQWADMFGSRYWRAGAMYRGTAQDLDKQNLASQSPEIMLVEVLVEIMEVRSLLGTQKGNLVLCISKKQPGVMFGGNRRVSICPEAKETQVVLLHCEPKGMLLYELFDIVTESTPKSLGTTLISLPDMLKSTSKLTTQKRLEFGSGAEPITLGVAVSVTPPSPAPYYAIQMITEYGCLEMGGGCKSKIGGGCKGDMGEGCKINMGAGCRIEMGARCKSEKGAGCKSEMGAGCRIEMGARCKSEKGAGCKSEMGAGCRIEMGARCKSEKGAGCKSEMGAGCKTEMAGVVCLPGQCTGK